MVVRRLRDVGQKFATNRRTVVLTAPKISIPPELASLVEYLELPLPDRLRLRQIIDEVLVQVSKTHTLQRRLEPAGIDADGRQSAWSDRGRSGARDFASAGDAVCAVSGDCHGRSGGEEVAAAAVGDAGVRGGVGHRCRAWAASII